MIMQIVVDYGYNFIGARDVARNKQNLNFITNLYSTITIARCFLFLICCVVVLILTFFLPFLAEVRLLLFINCQCVFLSIFMPEWLYQGLEEMKFITIINVISRIIYVILIFLVVREQDDYILYPVVNNIGLLGAGVASYIILQKRNIVLRIINWQEILQMLKNGWNLFINNLCGGMMGYILSMFIGYFLSFRDAGIYSSSSRLISAANHALGIISRVFFPFLSQNISKHTKFFILNMIIGFGVMTFTFVFTPFIFNLFYPSEFSDGILIMRIMSINIFFSCINNSLSSNFLILQGKEVLVRNMGFINLLIGSICFLFAIKFYGLIGAAIISVIISMINTVIFGYFTIKIKREMNPYTNVFGI